MKLKHANQPSRNKEKKGSAAQGRLGEGGQEAGRADHFEQRGRG